MDNRRKQAACGTAEKMASKNKAYSSAGQFHITSNGLGHNTYCPTRRCHYLKRRNHSRTRVKVTANIRGGHDGHGLKFAVVAARFNDIVTKRLVEGACDVFERFGSTDIKTVWVPGSFELPVVASSMARSKQFDAILCVGAVVRGDTTHYDAVANSAASGVLSASTSTGVPCIFGVLTCDNMEQAFDRAGGKAGNKGEEAAMTAIEMANLMRDLKNQDIGVQPWFS